MNDNLQVSSIGNADSCVLCGSYVPEGFGMVCYSCSHSEFLLSDLIQAISRASNSYGDKLLELMDTYRVDSLRAITVEQALEYCDSHGIDYSLVLRK